MFTFYILIAISMIIAIAVIVTVTIDSWLNDETLFPHWTLAVMFAVIMFSGTVMIHNAFSNAVNAKLDGVTYECSGRNERIVCRTDQGN